MICHNFLLQTLIKQQLMKIESWIYSNSLSVKLN